MFDKFKTVRTFVHIYISSEGREPVLSCFASIQQHTPRFEVSTLHAQLHV